jgi:hypothetical protein
VLCKAPKLETGLHHHQWKVYHKAQTDMLCDSYNIKQQGWGFIKAS